MVGGIELAEGSIPLFFIENIIMDSYYAALIWKLAKNAYIIASDIQRSKEDRLTSTKFLLKINNQTIALNYEGTKFELYYTIFSIIALIREQYGTDIAHQELIKFYPELDSPEIFAALNSDLFDLTQFN